MNRNAKAVAKRTKGGAREAAPPATHRPRAAEGKKRKMSSSTAEMRTEGRTSDTLTAAVVTVSDSCSRGDRVDLSGPAVAHVLQKLRFQVAALEGLPEDFIQI